MSDIFTSYKSEDQARAKVLASALERQGWSVWWDRKILPGERFRKVIEEELGKARCIIVLWSKWSVKSDWVQDEAAEGNRRRILVPAKIDDVEIPLGFKSVQAAWLVNWEGRSPHPGYQLRRHAERSDRVVPIDMRYGRRVACQLTASASGHNARAKQPPSKKETLTRSMKSSEGRSRDFSRPPSPVHRVQGVVGRIV